MQVVYAQSTSDSQSYHVGCFHSVEEALEKISPDENTYCEGVLILAVVEVGVEAPPLEVYNYILENGRFVLN